MRIDCDLDGGSIEVISARDAADVELALRRDTEADFMQWFHFRARGARKKPCRFQIRNAGEATYPDAFEGYRACASYDGGDRWFRVPTSFDGATLTIAHTPERESVMYAYFAPYPMARHEALIARAVKSGAMRSEVLGASVQGRPMTLLVAGEAHDGDGDDDGDEDRPRIWITARQHPGETMAEWLMEGVVDRLSNPRDETTRALLARATFYLVPNMNPDGGVLGNLRANAAGRNLNRAWLEPDEDETPEVLAVRARMLDTGVDLFLDVHGDERHPYCFAAGCEGNPGYSERIDALEDLFMNSLMAFDPEFQRKVGYENDPPGEGDLTAASNYVGEAFDCLSLTLEMPFKDDANHPDPAVGWSPARARRLGAAALDSIAVCLDTLR